MLFRSVDDRMITKMLPNTFQGIREMGWYKNLPSEEVYKAFYDDFYPLAMAKKSGKLIPEIKL